ncbi:hypothetical protein GC173_11320 [bacterium]|nr:hypothetical protein [bacterium]
MTRLPLNRQTAPAFERRIHRLRPEMTAKFGSMTVHRMVAHLEATFRVSVGTAACEDLSNVFLRSRPIRWLAINVLPLPKGVIKAPASITPEPTTDFEGSRKALLEQLTNFVEAAEAEPDRRTLDPWLGMITLREWSKVHSIHLDHHLGQFGVTRSE